MSEMRELIEKTREYLDYIEEHYNNVQKAWELVQEKCSDMKFVWDDFEWATLNQEIRNHDAKKLSIEEFVHYREKFHPTKEEEMLCAKYFEVSDMINKNFKKAWSHHKRYNDHHWQTWSNKNYGYPNMASLNCVHMLVDWIAMSMKFGDTAIDYYQKNKHTMTLPEWADEFIMSVLNRVYGVFLNENEEA